MLEKANMLLLTKEATEKDRSAKTQLLLSTNSQLSEKISGEQIWKKNGFFFDKRADFNIEKENFPENALCYVNQAYLSIVKGRELAIYNHNFILEQLVVAAKRLENIDEYNCEKNDVKLIVCPYDKAAGEFLELNLQLAYMILQGDREESFFSYGYHDKKSKFLYSAAKDRILNAIISTCFKKHFHEIMNERRHNEESSSLFFYLLSITDCKEKINQFRENVNLNPIDSSLELLSNFSPDKVDFKPHLLNSSMPGKRDPQVELLYNFFRQMTETSNANLIRNADYLLASGKQDNSKIVWIGPSKQRYGSTKFKLTFFFFRKHSTRLKLHCLFLQ